MTSLDIMFILVIAVSVLKQKRYYVNDCVTK